MELYYQYRDSRQYSKAYELLTKKIEEILKPCQGGNWVTQNNKDTLKNLYQEMTIISYYITKEEGLGYYDKIWLGYGDKMTANMDFYLEKLATIDSFKIGQGIIYPMEGCREIDLPRHSSNPSILNWDTGYLVNVRYVNTIYRYGKFEFFPTDGFIRTQNVLLHVDSNFKILSQHTYVEVLPRAKDHQAQIKGLEDCRLFWFEDGCLGFLCSIPDNLDRQIKIGRGRIPSVKKSMSDITENQLGVELEIIESPIGKNAEKNWLICQDKIIYQHHPFTLGEINNGQLKITNIISLPYTLIDHRGSAYPIKFGNGWLGIVHSHYNRAVDYRVYMHRFVWYDETLLPVKLSKWWYLNEKESEFVMSMCDRDTEVFISFGTDIEAWITKISKRVIEDMLTDIPVLYTL